jgi:hypothetical protein
MFKLKTILGAGLLLAAQSVAGHAVVVTQPFVIAFQGADGPLVPSYIEDGMMLVGGRGTGGQCGLAKNCMMLNPSNGPNNADFSSLTRVGGGQFTLTSFWLQLVGVGRNNLPQLTITAWLGSVAAGSVNYTSPAGNSGSVQSYFNANPYDRIVFSNTGKGTVRIDDVNGSYAVSAVPLPSGLPLLLSGLAGIGLLRRRRNKVVTV